MDDETIEIDGHQVPAHLVDLFYNGSDGSRVSDEQWDEQKARLVEAGEWPWASRA